LIALLPVPGLPLVAAGDDLAGLVLARLAATGQALATGDVVVVAQKIVSKAEGRLVDLATVTPGAEARDWSRRLGKDARLLQLILDESVRVVRHRAPGLIICEHRLGHVMANAGIDQSNVTGDDEHALLLPVDPDASARALRQALEAATGQRLGVIIADSFGRPWRVGVTGVAIGVSGLPAVIDRRGAPDIFGRPLRTTDIGIADEIASAASLLMGQADEACPVVVVRGLDLPFADAGMRGALRSPDEDLFR